MEYRFWQLVIISAAIPSVLRLINQSFAENILFKSIQQGGLGLIIAIAVGATIVKYKTENPYIDQEQLEKYRQHQGKKIYTSQIVMGFFIGIALLSALIWGPKELSLEASGAFLVPIIFISPGLLLRELIIKAFTKK